MKLLLVAFGIIACILSGCASSTYLQCRKWHLQGYIMASLDACEKCMSHLNSQDPEQVQACALGMEAAKLLEE